MILGQGESRCNRVASREALIIDEGGSTMDMLNWGERLPDA